MQCLRTGGGLVWLWCASWLVAAAAPPRAVPVSVEADPAPTFIRFVAEGTQAGQVQTAVRLYRDAAGAEVTLFSAVHVADRSYYEELQRRFRDCDALLYEMIRDRDDEFRQPEVDHSHPVSQLQIGMKRLLALDFQLDAIDYTPTNFVHADLDPATFFRLQTERQESLLALMIRVMLEEQARLNSGEGTSVGSLELLMALMNPDRAYALKLVLGRQMDQLERMVAGIDSSADGAGSLIVSALNHHAMEVLSQTLAHGARRLGIFYGAGHMADFDERLRARGFRCVGEEWLTAWDIRPGRKP